MELSPVYPLRDESVYNSSPSRESPTVAASLDQILKGVTAYVEVRSNAENRSRAIAHELQELGAAVSSRLTTNISHVIFREGRQRTLKWAKRHSVPIVSVGWIQACKRTMCRISESRYPAIPNDQCSDEPSPATLPLANQGRRRIKSMQPKDMDEELKLSADRKKRAVRRNAKRDALHRRVVEADNYLKNCEGEKTHNYYADPCIRVPKTPPSMKEFTERMERNRLSSDSESSVSHKLPVRNNVPENCKFRRRLFGSPIAEKKHADQEESVGSPVFPSRPPGASPIKSHRKLFNASAFEASGVLIEPQHSSNRVQSISNVFPKSFFKRKIIPNKPVTKRKTVIMDASDDELTDTDELQFARNTKSRRIGSASPIFTANGIHPIMAANETPSSPFERTSDIRDNGFADENEMVADEAKNSKLPDSEIGYHTSANEGGQSDKSLASNSDDTDTIVGIVEALNRSSKRSKVDKSQQPAVFSNEKSMTTSKASACDLTLDEPTSSSSVADPHTSMGVLEIIDQSIRHRESLKRPGTGCSRVAKRKSVSFSDSINVNGKSLTEEIPSQDSSHNKIPLIATVLESPPIDRDTVTRRKTLGSATPVKLRRSLRLSSLNTTPLVAGKKPKRLSGNRKLSRDTELLACTDIVSEAGKVHVKGNKESPKRRRSSRLVGPIFHGGSPASNKRNLRSKSMGSVTNSSCTSKLSSLVSLKDRRSYPTNNIRSQHTSGSSSNISCTDIRHRLKYTYGERSSQEQGETAYGVLDIPKPKRRESRRYSVKSVIKALTSENENGEVTPEPLSQACPSRTSLDDFKSSPSLSVSSNRQRKILSTKNRPRHLNKSCPSGQHRRELVFTSLHNDEQATAKKALAVLGNCRLRQSVSDKTTHLVTTWPIRRTLNLLRAVLFGCHIVNLSWLIESREAGCWLPEEDYKIGEVPGPDQQPAIRHLFNEFNGIYVNSGVSPPQKDLKELIKMAGGKIEETLVTSSQSASVIVSSQSGDSCCVSPKWILDSIMESEALPLEEYQTN